MSTTIESVQDNSSSGNTSLDFKPQGFTLRRKIVAGFSGIMLLMTLCIVITLFKLSTIEKSAVSVIEHQQPTTALILTLSGSLNFSISLLNEYLLSGNETDLASYQLTEQRLYIEIEKIETIAKESNDSIFLESTKTLKSLFDEFGRRGAWLVYLKDNPLENYPGIKLATEKINPPALEYLGLINTIIDEEDLNTTQKNEKEIRALLDDARYTWTQMMISLRLYLSQSTDFSQNIHDPTTSTKIGDGLFNFRNYSALNKKILNKLREIEKSGIDFGFDTIEHLLSLRKEYLTHIPTIENFRHSGTWRTDVTLIRSKIRPLVKKMRLLLIELVGRQTEATQISGNALTSSLKQIRTSIIVLLAFALGGGLLLSIMITNSILPPLKKLMEAARLVASGQLNAEVHVVSKDEISLLGGSFNRMIYELRKAEIQKQQYTDTLETLNAELEDRVASRSADLQRSEARIRAIYDNVGEGIIVIDDKGYIDSINAAAKRIFSIEDKDVVGMHAIFLLADKKYNDLKNFSDYNDEQHGPFKTSNSKHPVELEGKRPDGATFPMEMVVTSMALGESHMRACIVRDITGRKESEQRLAEAQTSIVNAAHKSGMAEMATGVLHNIGNILNSVNVSIEVVTRIGRDSKIQGLLKANALLSDNLKHVGEFISHDSKGKMLPDYYIKVGNIIENEFKQITDEFNFLREKTTMMKEVISTQQAYATVGFFTEKFQITQLIDDALTVEATSLYKWGVNVTKKFTHTPDVTAQKSKLLQVVTNLIKNAKEATAKNDGANKKKEMIIETGTYNKNTVYISVYDNGCGINEDNLSSIFNHGFTTKETGHGFGLHTSANSMTEMGGSLTVSSDGLQRGACFTISIPVANSKKREVTSNNHENALKTISKQ